MTPHNRLKTGAPQWWLPLLLGLALTLASAWAIQWQHQRKLLTQANALADEAEAQIHERFRLFEYGLRAARGVIITAGVEQISRELFENYINSRDLASEFPGALGFGFIRRVSVAEEQEFLARAQADGAPQFNLRTLTPHDDERFIIQYIYPIRGNERAVGLDIASESNRRKAALDAARENQTHLTAPITLVQADGKPRRGFLILLPVYSDHDIPADPAARERAAVGWAYAPLVVDDVLADLRQVMDQAYITLTDPREDEPFYRSPNADAPDLLDQQVLRNIAIMGQVWKLTLTPRASLLDRLGLWSVGWVILLGLGLTALVMLVNHLLRARLPETDAEDAPPSSGRQSLGQFMGEMLFRRSWPPTLLALLVVWAVASWLIVEQHLRGVATNLTEANHSVHDWLEQVTTRYSRDLLFLSATPPITGLMPSESGDGDPLSGSTTAQWKERLAVIFQAYMLANPEVYQVRMIKAEDGWREVVKVLHANGRLEVVEDDKLQSKAAEPYVSETLKLAKGQLYVSNIDLNREFGAVERPHQPVWRFATPLFRNDGNPFAMVILNVSADQILQSVAERTPTSTTLYITNSEGDFLRHPYPERTFNFAFGQHYRWRDEFKPSSGWKGSRLRRFEHWQGPLGRVWAARSELVPSASSASGRLEIINTLPQFPVYQTMALQSGGVLLLCIGLGLITFLLQYQRWLETRRRQWAERQQHRQLLQQKETTLFKALLESAPEAALIVDDKGVIQLANAQAEQLFGYPRSDLEGQSVHKLLPQNLRSTHQNHIANFMRNPQARPMGPDKTLLATRADESEFPAEISLSPVQSEGRILVSTSVRDISERLAKEAQLVSALRTAEQATQAKSAFLANTSHEIRTPLNAILGLAYMLADEGLSESQQRLVQKIQISGRSLLGIVNDVLDLSKIEANEVEIEPIPVELHEILEEVGSIFAPQAETKQLHFSLELHHLLPRWVIADPTRLRQILFNLLANALKFTETGSVILRAELAPDVEVQSETTKRIRLTVADTGIGISTEALARLFKPFTQADASTTRRFGGTGLGLSIVQKLTNLLGGEVGVESNEGVGSQFWVELTLRIPTEQEIATQDNQNQSLFVFVAEDDLNDASRLLQMSRALGWRSHLVADGKELVEEFMKRLASDLRPPDALLVDWQMPSMDGLEAIGVLAREIGRDRLPAILMISAHDAERIAALDKERLLHGILHKPVNASTLFGAVNEVVTQHTGDTRRVMQATRIEAVRAHWLPGVRLLVVDDSQTNLDVVTQMLQRNGAEVETAMNGYAALDCLRAKPDAFDAVLMDVQMPGISGLETTVKVREELGLTELPIIALTAGALMEERRRALETGMNDFLAKPIEPTQLINRVRGVVETYRGRAVPVVALQQEEDLSVAWPKIAGLNAQRAQHLLGSDVRLLMSVLDRMMNEYTELASRPSAEINDPKSEALRQRIAGKVHKLRSASGSVGAERIWQLASQAENALRSSNQPASDLLTQLAAELNALREASLPALEAWRQEREARIVEQTEPDPAAASDEAATEPLPGALQRILDLITTNDMAVLGEVSQHRSALQATLGTETFLELEDCLVQLDFARSLELLKPFIRTNTSDT